MRDVVVVGAGHNGLVAACYLARAGLDVEVVERDTVLGGATSTVERWPGHLVDRGSSAHLMVRQTGIVEELDLAGAGLRYVDLDPWAWHPSGIAFHVSVEETCASIARVCGERDAEAYAAFVRTWLPRARRIARAFESPPTTSHGLRLFATLGRGDDSGPAELSRQMLQSAESLVCETFSDERLRTALCWLAAQSGPPPWLSGTAPMLGWHTTLHETPPGRAVGGSGALAAALRRRLEAEGGTVRLGDGAARINGHEVVTQSGETIRTRAVVAACHVWTAMDLCGDDLPASVRERRSAVRVGDGIGMVVRLGTTALPSYPDAPAGAANGLQLLVSSREQLRAAHGDFERGRPPAEPAVLAMSFSAVDPSVAPPGKHSVSLWGQWHRYDLGWETLGRREADKLIAAAERFAPGFASSIEHVHVQTPADLERELGLPRGNVMHVEMELDALFALRPLPELAAHRTPVPGLYLTGASTHPGGGVSGASGRSAARVVLDDVKPRRRGSAGVVRRATAAALGVMR